MDRDSRIILYGSYGYTGKLIASECRSKNLNVILSGRNHDLLQRQSKDTGYPFEVVEVNDSRALQDLLKKGSVVIHCAGPFQFTARAMADACLETQTHYTDITGEFQVFEMLAGYDEKAREKGITILPGAGFDVVPSDCLALHLKSRLPSATHLQLAFVMSKGGLSRGTAKTSIEGLGEGSVIRKNGKLISVQLGEKIISVNFGSLQSKALNIPWGDIATAWRSTGIPNIEVYMGASDKMISFAGLSKYVNWLLRKRWFKNFLHKRIDARPEGPDENRRLSGKSFLWGKVWNAAGEIRESHLETLSGYELTAKTSVHIAGKILGGNFKSGYQTPASAFGKDLILEIPGTRREDL